MTAPPELYELWPVGRAAVFLGVSPSWIYRKVEKGELPVVRMGGALRFRPEALATWVQERTKRPGSE